jgi:hypothetical protein
MDKPSIILPAKVMPRLAAPASRSGDLLPIQEVYSTGNEMSPSLFKAHIMSGMK